MIGEWRGWIFFPVGKKAFLEKPISKYCLSRYFHPSYLRYTPCHMFLAQPGNFCIWGKVIYKWPVWLHPHTDIRAALMKNNTKMRSPFVQIIYKILLPGGRKTDMTTTARIRKKWDLKWRAWKLAAESALAKDLKNLLANDGQTEPEQKPSSSMGKFYSAFYFENCWVLGDTEPFPGKRFV